MTTAADPTIEITVNGEARTVTDSYPLPSLLRDLEIEPEETSGVAVAINREVVRKQDWADTTLAAGDTVEVIQAQQGG